MKNDYIVILNDTKNELLEIKKWIDQEKNKFDSKSRLLISYSIIKACGSIEVVFKHIIFDCLSDGVNDKTVSYIEKMILDSSCNPSTRNMGNMLQKISPLLKNNFENRLKLIGKKDKINSLVQLRNDFAHGDSIRVSIETVVTYFSAAVEVLNILDEVVLNN